MAVMRTGSRHIITDECGVMAPIKLDKLLAQYHYAVRHHNKLKEDSYSYIMVMTSAEHLF